ncbi:hypothetical protein BGZ76_001864 [Entomortierella beljakovae]|nr:hypothetical protein BGZ76_001864 [Entomortierella beljakovae]
MTDLLNPFEIPELRNHLAYFLHINELYVCIQVCKIWKASFLPMLYYHIVIKSFNSEYEAETLVKYSNNVRFLDIADRTMKGYQSIDFTHLVKLVLSPGSIPGMQRRYFLRNFLAPNVVQLILKSKSSLKSFTLRCNPLEYPIQEIWDTLLLCDNISEVSLYRLNLDFNLQGLVSILSRVTTLCFWSLKKSDIKYNLQELIQSIQSSNLRRIRYNGSKETIRALDCIAIQLISKSPYLRQIEWWGYEITDPFVFVDKENGQTYREMMLSMKSNHLENLDFKGSMCDDDTALMLQAMTNAKEVRFQGPSFEQQSYMALMSGHSNTIVKLDIKHCIGVSSSMVQGILSRCPSLYCFEAGYIRGTDLIPAELSDHESAHGSEDQEKITHSTDWVCLKLHCLRLFFDLSSIDSNIDRSSPDGEALFQKQQKLEQIHAFQQLSRLVYLEKLDVSGGSLIDKSVRSLDLRLKSNGGELERLENLKRIQAFYSTRGYLGVDNKEEHWMRNNWSLPACDKPGDDWYYNSIYSADWFKD